MSNPATPPHPSQPPSSDDTGRQALAYTLASHPLLLAHVYGTPAPTEPQPTIDLEGSARDQVHALARILHRTWTRTTQPPNPTDLTRMHAELVLLRDIAAGAGLTYLAQFDTAAPTAHVTTMPPRLNHHHLLTQLNAILTLPDHDEPTPH